jgi:hypothetical protein
MALRSAGLNRVISAIGPRFVSNTAKDQKDSPSLESALVKREGQSTDVAEHQNQPDYNATIDHGTS